MAILIRKKKQSREERRLTRSSTKRGFVIRPLAHPGRILAVSLAAVAIVALALVWGSRLKAKSDAYREALEMDAWTVDPDMAPAAPVPVPDIRAAAILPEGSVEELLAAGDHQGVILPLCEADGTLLYASDLATAAARPVHPEAPSLKADAARVSQRGLRVICAFRVTFPEAGDPVTSTYLRGLELALLREYAEAGMDDLLLFGLPAGSRDRDETATAFLADLRALLSDLPEPPALGVALPLSCMTAPDSDPSTDPSADTSADTAADPQGESPLYAGNISPARLLNACDYLALDLRDQPPARVAAILPNIRYAYVRYSLRLLMNPETPEGVEDALSHGFARIFEMPPEEMPPDSPGEKTDAESQPPQE